VPTLTQVITSGTTWTVPAGVTSATVECIGSGDLGGGAYAKTNSVSLTPGATVYIRINAGGSSGPTWFNKTANTAPTSGQTDRGALAASGDGTSQIGGFFQAPGGQASNSVGDVRYSGGAGRYYQDLQYCSGLEEFILVTNRYCCGGAAGPNGNGGSGLLSSTGSGGGGANGGSSATNNNGGNNRFGVGGGVDGGAAAFDGGGGDVSRTGSYEAIYTDSTSGLTYGPAGGSGPGSVAPVRGAGGGANSGSGRNGLIVVTYESSGPASTGNMLMLFQ